MLPVYIRVLIRVVRKHKGKRLNKILAMPIELDKARYLKLISDCKSKSMSTCSNLQTYQDYQEAMYSFTGKPLSGAEQMLFSQFNQQLPDTHYQLKPVTHPNPIQEEKQQSSYLERQAESLYQGLQLVGAGVAPKIIGKGVAGSNKINPYIVSGSIGGGVGAFSYMATTSQQDFDPTKLAIYTIGGVATAVTAQKIDNFIPSSSIKLQYLNQFTTNTVGAFATQTYAEGWNNTNLSSALIYGTGGIVSYGLGKAGCGVLCQASIVAVPTVTSATISDKINGRIKQPHPLPSKQNIKKSGDR